ncbi:MAG: transposase zinc-binding domain-containing protein [Myxococcales bacterium]|nr:transposase zinc-binding domain-containing protein [Myxococcales bacterium]
MVREFEEYLRCGLLEHGVVRLACRQCGHEMLVAFSCKRRGWTPRAFGALVVSAESASFAD